MSAHLRYDELNAKTDDISCKDLGKDRPQPVEELTEEPKALACGQMMLVADIPHAEKATWKECDDYSDHCALGVI